MTALVLIPLLYFQHVSEERATICTVAFAISVAAWRLATGYVLAYAIGQFIGVLIFGGLYFGFLGRLDKSRWVYWTVLVVGGLVLVSGTS